MEKNNLTTIDSIHMLCCAVFFWNGRTLRSPQRCPHLLCGTGGRGTGGTGGVIPKTFPQGRTLEWQERHGVTKGPDSRHAHGMNDVHPKGVVRLVFLGNTHPGDTSARSWAWGLEDGTGVLGQMAGRWGMSTVSRQVVHQRHRLLSPFVEIQSGAGPQNFHV